MAIVAISVFRIAVWVAEFLLRDTLRDLAELPLLLLFTGGVGLLYGSLRWIALRGTRGLAYAPPHLLDQRQVVEVRSAYRKAYGITADCHIRPVPAA
ncbi:hypothetical protein [Streptomyces solincola]|uniref:hypothetical protein n=1 Tax=Streptomyces solincola TaxID=2100817 RepID=UPI0011B29E3D|nr:hypothetical protein [Streptomyces solincola]